MDPSIFVPKVYNFTLASKLADSILSWELDSYDVNCPPFQILLDHTYAVIWHMFDDDGNELANLNKSDISWALKLLESIDTSDSDENDTKDLHALMNFMRKLLISRYAFEDEKQHSIDSQTFHESIKSDLASSTSFALDEYLNDPDVLEDSGKALPIEAMMLQEVEVEREKCTKSELLERLKLMQNDEANVSLDDAIKLLENE